MRIREWFLEWIDARIEKRVEERAEERVKSKVALHDSVTLSDESLQRLAVLLNNGATVTALPRPANQPNRRKARAG